MNSAAFVLGQQLNNHKVPYVLHKPLWDRFSYPNIDLNFHNWHSIKYLNDEGTDFSMEIDQVPNDQGGLYLFYVKCDILIGLTEYPFYIGRAQLTAGQNLRKRVKEYYQKYSREDERPRIYRMLNSWGRDLYLAYYVLNDNNDTINIERDIINSLLLPMNDLIPNKLIKDAIKAFDS